MKERINLVDLLESEPKKIEIDGKIINVNGGIFNKGIIKTISINKYAGVRSILFYSENKQIYKYLLLNKKECLIESVIEENGEEIVLITVI